MKKGDLIFGVFILITLILLIFSLLPKQYPDHCSDNILNFDEEEIDCGVSCIPCYEKYPGLSKATPIISIIVIFVSFLAILLIYKNINSIESKIHHLVNEAENLIEKDFSRSVLIYREIKEHYKKLPSHKQKKVYQKTLNLHKKLSK